MTCRLSLAALLALALAGCEATREPAQPGGWRALLARGDGAAAELSLRGALSGGAPVRELAPFLGEAELLQGNLGEARGWLEGAEFAPAVAGHGFHMLGRLRMREGDLPRAGQAFDQALATTPDDPELWVDIGRLRWRGGEQAQAIEASKKAVALVPGNSAALLFRAQLVRDSQGNAAAVALFERGLAGSPGHPDLLADYAATLGELGRAREMLAAVRRMPPGPRSLYLQAVLAARAGRNDLARSLLERSGEPDRAVPAAMLLLALIDLDNGNVKSAAQGFDRLLRRQPDNHRIAHLLARSLAQGGNHRELVARFGDKADTPYLALLVGRAYEALGERDRAAPFLDRAHARRAARLVTLRSAKPLETAQARGARDGPNAVALVRALITEGRAAEARTEAATFLAAHPGSADAMALAGDAALAAGDARAALAHYGKAAAIRRPWPLTKRMAFALDRSGRRRDAAALVREQLAGEPGNAEAREWLERLEAS